MGKRYGLVIDSERCIGCIGCWISCKMENSLDKGSGIRVDTIGGAYQDTPSGKYPNLSMSYLPVPCMHCDDPSCIKESNAGAVIKRKDGIVIIDPEKAKGQEDLVNACPYGAIWWNSEKSVPQKCTFCAHLLDEGWKEPRCVQACPTGALKIIQTEDAEMNKIVKADDLKTYLPDLATNPRVYYANLNRYERCFIAGNVVLQDKDECAENAKLTLKKDEKVIQATSANSYGDFKFDNLFQDSGEYVLEATYPGYNILTVTVALKASVSVNSLFLLPVNSD